MSARFLLDTMTLSEEQAVVPESQVLDRIRMHRNVIALAAPTAHELRFGIHRLPAGKRRARLVSWVDAIEETLPVLPYDLAAASWHAEERAHLVDAGHTPPFIDGQIAAIAATSGLTLVTRNLKDFKRFRGLRVESWWPGVPD